MLDQIKQANRFKICHILEVARNEKKSSRFYHVAFYIPKKNANLEVFC